MPSSFRVLYLIIARGGSKGVPRKNLRAIGGKSLIAYKAIAARNAKSCSRLIVSSEDEEIIEEAKRYGAESLFVRPAELASDTAGSAEVILHAMEWMEKHEGQSYDAIMLLEPASPFATADYFDRAVTMMQEKEANLVVGVRETEVSSIFVGTMGTDGSIAEIVNKITNVKGLRRQDQPKEVTMNGAFYLINWEFFKRQRMIYADTENSYGIMMPEAYSLEIETPLDLAYGEFLVEHKYIDISPWEL
jgi:CMP-N,N'-diacetyllegionaminic acid synthase